MDPIQAFRIQQQRNGFEEKPKTLEELAAANPRAAAAFDIAGGSHLEKTETHGLTRQAATQALRRCVGQKLPESQLNMGFQRNQRRLADPITFRKFCDMAVSLEKYMKENSDWEQDEDDDQPVAQRARSKQSAAEPDLFELLNLPKSKDVIEVEKRKEQALKNAAAQRLRATGASVLASRRITRGITAGPIRRATIGEDLRQDLPAAKPKASRRFQVTQGPSRRREFAVTAAVQLPKELLEQQIRSHDAACFSLRFSPDGSLLAGGFYDGGLRIYDPDAGEMMHCLNLRQFKGGTRTPKIDYLEAKEQRVDEELRQQLAHLAKQDQNSLDRLNFRSTVLEPAVTCLRWRPVSKGPHLVATVNSSGRIDFWEVPRKTKHGAQLAPRQISQIQSRDGSLYACAFSEGGGKFYVAGGGRMLYQYDMQVINSWSPQAGDQTCPCQSFGDQEHRQSRITAHTSQVMSICTHPDNDFVVYSGGIDGRILIWDTRSGNLPVGCISGVDLCGDALDVSKDGYRILAGSHRSKSPIQIFDVRRSVFDTDSATVSHSLAGGVFDPSERSSRPAASDVTAQAGDAVAHDYAWRGDEVPFANGCAPSSCRLFSAAWDADARTVVACGEDQNLARVFTLKSSAGEPLEVVGTCQGEHQSWWSSAVSADGRSVAFGAADGAVAIGQVRQV